VNGVGVGHNNVLADRGTRRCCGQVFEHSEGWCSGLQGNRARRLGQARLQPDGLVSR
jgi:hypothetical protein